MKSWRSVAFSLDGHGDDLYEGHLLKDWWASLGSWLATNFAWPTSDSQWCWLPAWLVSKEGVEPIHRSPGISHLSLDCRSSALKAICKRTGGLCWTVGGATVKGVRWTRWARCLIQQDKADLRMFFTSHKLQKPRSFVSSYFWHLDSWGSSAFYEFSLFPSCK